MVTRLKQGWKMYPHSCFSKVISHKTHWKGRDFSSPCFYNHEVNYFSWLRGNWSFEGYIFSLILSNNIVPANKKGLHQFKVSRTCSRHPRSDRWTHDTQKMYFTKWAEMYWYYLRAEHFFSACIHKSVASSYSSASSPTDRLYNFTRFRITFPLTNTKWWS